MVRKPLPKILDAPLKKVHYFAKKGALFCQKGPHFVQKNPPAEVFGYGIDILYVVGAGQIVWPVYTKSQHRISPNVLWTVLN